MRAIGQISEAPKKEDKGPECPSVFLDVFDKYRALKFVRRETEEAVKLYARDMLNWQDIIAFKAATGHSRSILECELRMGLDGVFAGRDDG